MDKSPSLSAIVYSQTFSIFLVMFPDYTKKNLRREESKGFPNSFILKHLIARLTWISGAVFCHQGRSSRVESSRAEVGPNEEGLLRREAVE